MGLRLKNSALHNEIIYARLEKQGIPDDLAREVARDVLVERKKDKVKQAEAAYEFAWFKRDFKIVVGLLVALISYLTTSNVVFPIGITIGGLVALIVAKWRLEQ